MPLLPFSESMDNQGFSSFFVCSGEEPLLAFARFPGTVNTCQLRSAFISSRIHQRPMLQFDVLWLSGPSKSTVAIRFILNRMSFSFVFSHLPERKRNLQLRAHLHSCGTYWGATYLRAHTPYPISTLPLVFGVSSQKAGRDFWKYFPSPGGEGKSDRLMRVRVALELKMTASPPRREPGNFLYF